MVRFLSSTKLAVVLCLVLAAAGTAGSILYQGNTAFGKQGTLNVFRSPIFLVPAGLLVLNILFCAGSRLRVLSPRQPRAWTFAGIHLGLILLSAGLFADGLFGFVATQYFHAGVPHSGYFNWRTGREESFPFSVEVADLKVRYHPLNLQVGVKDGGGNKVGVFTVREGVPFRVGEGGAVVVTPRSFDIESKTLLFDAAAGGETFAGLSAGAGGSAPVAGYTVVPVSYADPEPSDYAVRARFAVPGRAAVEKVIRVNHPATFAGISFCFVGEDRDRYGFPLVGLQMTREPGEPLFWAGGLLFGLSFLLHLYVRRAALAANGADAARETARAMEPRGSGAETRADATARRRGGEGTVPGATAGILLLIVLSAAGAGDAAAFPGREQGTARVITGYETWEGEVRVTAPVTVEKGGTLRIRPGTAVLLSGEDRDGDGCRDGYIQALGSVLVEGEKGRPVAFRRLDPEKEWQEVFLLGATAVIRHAVFEGAAWGLHVHDGDVRVENATFRGNGGGARLKGTGASFTRCTFRENGVALRFWNGGPAVASSIIEGNGTGLFYREGTGGGRIAGSRIANREWDVKIGDWAAGDLDASGNYWGSAGEAPPGPRVKDFRENRDAGRIVLSPALSSPPAGCGADHGGDR